MNENILNILREGMGESFIIKQKLTSNVKNYKSFYESYISQKEMGLYLKESSTSNTINSVIDHVAFSEDKKEKSNGRIRSIFKSLIKFIKKIIGFLFRNNDILKRLINFVSKLNVVIPKLKEIDITQLELDLGNVKLPDFRIFGFKLKAWEKRVTTLYKRLGDENGEVVDVTNPNLKESMKLTVDAFIKNQHELPEIKASLENIERARSEAQEKLKRVKEQLESSEDKDTTKIEKQYSFLNVTFKAIFDGEKEVLNDIKQIFNETGSVINEVKNRVREESENKNKVE